MTQSELEQLRQLPRAQIATKYLKALAFKQITEQQFKWLVSQGMEECTEEPKETIVEPILTSENEREALTPDEIDDFFNPSKTSHPDKIEGKSQNERIAKYLFDGEWHTTPEIQKACYGADHLGSAAIPSRVSDLNKKGYNIESKQTEIRQIWKYKMTV